MDYSKDYYSILGVAPQADPVVIRAAYKALITKFHPDRNPSAEALLVAKSLTEAISVLGDSVRRLDYDLNRLERLAPQDSTFRRGSHRITKEAVGAKSLVRAFSAGPAQRSRTILGVSGLIALFILFVLAVLISGPS
ncbi:MULTISPECIES: J domain-containing protein [unclassified Sphingomonas]|uniref:J domain-containing protein n=1 Tax=unclassified Sphingomonas TaxID=196159 RepID=UPI002269832E|nr:MULTISPECIES: J domain-containing protein [unclassified Sphingomonas]